MRWPRNDAGGERRYEKKIVRKDVTESSEGRRERLNRPREIERYWTKRTSAFFWMITCKEEKERLEGFLKASFGKIKNNTASQHREKEKENWRSEKYCYFDYIERVFYSEGKGQSSNAPDFD